jgi:phosphoribosyl 1,2-cyclic phosphodiesterase
MNECYITNKVRELFHVKPNDRTLRLLENEKKVEEIMDALHFEIRTSTELLERKIMRLLSLHMHEYLS